MATQKSEKPKNSTLLKGMMISITILTFIVSFLLYQVITSEDIPKTKEEKSSLFSFFDKKEEEEKLLELEDFTLKLKDGHYARLSINLGYTGEDETVSKKKPILRDRVIFVLMNLEEENLEVKEIMNTKSLLTENINSLLSEAIVKNIYIDNLVVQ